MNLMRLQIGKAVHFPDGNKYVPLISKRYICKKCRIFCIELTPVLTRMAYKILSKNNKMPEVKIYCKRGCHTSASWGWEIFNWTKIREINKISEWPEEWKKNQAALDKMIRGGK